MRKLANRYGALLRTRGVPSLLAASFVGRLPASMDLLLFIVVVHAGTGSYTLAGGAAAANSIATAVSGPLLGRLSDRGHAARVLAITGILEAASVVGLVLVLRLHGSGLAVAAVSVIAGIVMPPIPSVTRTVLPRLAPHAVTASFSLDALLIELTYVVGPTILGLTIAAWGGYAAAYVVAAFAAIGACWLAASSAVRHSYAAATQPRAVTVDSTGPESDAGRSLSLWRRIVGPMASRGLRTIMIVVLLQCAGFGVLEVAIPAYTTAHGMPQAAGLLFAVWSGGSIVGGLWFGAQDFRYPLGRQFSILMILNAVGFGAILLASGMYALGGVLFFAGLFIAPATTVQGALVTQLTPPEWTTEAFTWSTTSIYLGYALGTGIGSVALGGTLGTASALTVAAVIAVGLAAIGAALTVADRRALQPAPA